MIKEQRKKKKKRRKLLKVIIGMILLLALAAVIVIKVFRVKKVEVEGNVLYDAGVIQESVLNDKYSWNSLYVFGKYRFLKQKEIPFIDTMEVSLKNPTTLHIKVYEKARVGYLYIPSINENAYFDKDGFVVETSSETIGDVPMVEGLACDQVVLYEKLPIEDRRLKEILNLTQVLKKYEIEPTKISYGVAGEPALTYGNIVVLMGDLAKLTPKVERLAQILPSLAEQTGTLHIEKWTEENTDIVFQRAD